MLISTAIQTSWPFIPKPSFEIQWRSGLPAIAEEGYDPTYGARPLKRVIQQRVQNPQAVEMLRQEFGEGSGVKIGYRDGEFTFEREG